MKYQNKLSNFILKAYNHSVCKYIIITIIILLTIYLFLYNYYIKYVANIHELTDKDLIKQLWDIQITKISN
jgi:hypothetical protein